MDQNKVLLEMLDDRIKQVETNLTVLKSQKNELMAAVANQALNIKSKRGYWFGNERCESSPTNLCTFNLDTDPFWLHCCFCHEPHPKYG